VYINNILVFLNNFKDYYKHVCLVFKAFKTQAFSLTLKSANLRLLKLLIASEPAAVGQIARQLIQGGRLGQFRLASRLLYSR
jgi:hypothetical protein